MRQPRKGGNRLSLKQTIAANDKASKYYALMSGKPEVSPASLETTTKNLFEKTPRAKRDAPLEKIILKDTLKYLRLHPKVAWQARINSGTFMEGDRYISSTSQAGMSDVIGMFKHTGRFFVIEAKRIGEKPTQPQQDFIDLIVAGGGLGMVAYTIDQVIEFVNSA